VTTANSSGNKVRLGGITKAGNRYLRQMLVVGAMVVIRHAERNGRPPAVARAIAGTHGDEARRHRARKQDGAHSVGVDDQR
jgi:transposase